MPCLQTENSFFVSICRALFGLQHREGKHLDSSHDLQSKQGLRSSSVKNKSRLTFVNDMVLYRLATILALVWHEGGGSFIYFLRAHVSKPRQP